MRENKALLRCLWLRRSAQPALCRAVQGWSQTEGEERGLAGIQEVGQIRGGKYRDWEKGRTESEPNQKMAIASLQEKVVGKKQ